MENVVSPSNNESITQTMTENTTKIAQESNAPGGIKVVRRNGMVTPYDDTKINIAITKAFLAVEGGNAAS